MHKLITLVSLLVLAVASLGPSAALASKSPPPPNGTPDQQYTASPDMGEGVSSGQYVAQTYTASRSGSLLTVGLDLSVSSVKPNAGFQVSIYNASGGFPTGSALYTSTVFKPRVGKFPSATWFNATIPAGTVAQVSGSEYAIVLTSASAGNAAWLWDGATAAGYGGGQADTYNTAAGYWTAASGYGGSSIDLDFQTYVG